MNATYEWLYEKSEELLEEVSKAENAELERLARRLQLTELGRIDLFNNMTELRVRWAAEIFALGLQLGIRLTAPTARDM